MSVTDRIVVLSQDCDLLHPDLVVEPTVECLVLRPTNQVDGNLRYGKSARRLQLDTQLGLANFDMRERGFFPREILEGSAPAEYIGEDAILLLSDWVARRYVRPALPDAFVERLRPAEPKIRKALKFHADQISGMYIHITPWDEVSEDQDYMVMLVLTARAERAKDAETANSIEFIAAKVAELMTQCPGISVIDSRFLSEANFTLDDLRLFKRMSLDDLSQTLDSVKNNAPRP